MENKNYRNSTNVASYRSVPEQFVKTMCLYVKRNYLSKEEPPHDEELEEEEEENEEESHIVQKLLSISADYEEIDEEMKLSWFQFTAFQHVLTQWVDIILALQKISQKQVQENSKNNNKSKNEKEHSEVNNLNNSNEQTQQTEIEHNSTKLRNVYDVDELTNSQCTNDLIIEKANKAGWLFANLNTVVNAHMSFAHQSILPTPWSHVNVINAQVSSLFDSIATLCHLYELLHKDSTFESNVLKEQSEENKKSLCIEPLIASLWHFAKQDTTQKEETFSENSNEIISLNLSQFITMWMNAIYENNKITEETDPKEQNTSTFNYHNRETQCTIELNAKLVFFELLRLSLKTESNLQWNEINAKNRISFLHLERSLKYFAMNVFPSRKVKYNMKCEENREEQPTIFTNKKMDIYNNSNNNQMELKFSVGILYGLALHHPMHIASSLNNFNDQNHNTKEKNTKAKIEQAMVEQKRKRKRISDSDTDYDEESSSDNNNDVIEEIVIDNNNYNSDDKTKEIKPFEIDLHNSRWRRAQRWRTQVMKQRALSHKQQLQQQQHKINTNQSKLNSKIGVNPLSMSTNKKETNQMITLLTGQGDSWNRCNVNVNITNYDVEVISGILICFNKGNKTEMENVREHYVHNATVHWYTQGNVTADNYGSNSTQVEKLLLELQRQPTRTKSNVKQRFSKRKL